MTVFGWLEKVVTNYCNPNVVYFADGLLDCPKGVVILKAIPHMTAGDEVIAEYGCSHPEPTKLVDRKCGSPSSKG